MDKIDLLVMRFRDKLATDEALLYVDPRILSGQFPGAQKNRIHVQLDLLKELAEEIGSPIKEKDRDGCWFGLSVEYSIEYDGFTIFSLGGRNGTS